ncbi:hypothetical protein ACFL5M_05870 [Candidatus Neomarinimicrobiota bacterium]
MIKVTPTPDERVCQGDILRDVEYFERATEQEGIIEVAKIRFPLVIVLTQDCDLQQDYKFRVEDKATQDKWLISVLVAPLYNAEHVYGGEHLSKIGISSESINRSSTDGRLLKQNQKPRYHFLEFPQEMPLVPSVIDFKHYFSVPVVYLRELKKTNFLCKVSELYREDISQRFAAFLSRIGLPDIK